MPDPWTGINTMYWNAVMDLLQKLAGRAPESTAAAPPPDREAYRRWAIEQESQGFHPDAPVNAIDDGEVPLSWDKAIAHKRFGDNITDSMLTSPDVVNPYEGMAKIPQAILPKPAKRRLGI